MLLTTMRMLKSGFDRSARMLIEVVSFDEDTYQVTLDIDKEGMQYLVAVGFNALLREALRKEETCSQVTNSCSV